MAASIRGLQKLNAALDAFGKAAKNKMTRKAVGPAGTPLVKEAKSLVQKDSGTLRKSIAKKVKTTKTGAICIVGPRKDAPYGHPLESGHENADGSRTPPYPFMQPALDNKHDELIEIVAKKLAEQIAKYRP